MLQIIYVNLVYRKKQLISLYLKKFNLKDTIIIGTDSKYLINSITIWFPTWEKNNWKNSKNEDVKNLDLIKKIRKYYLKYNIVFKYIKVLIKENHLNQNLVNILIGMVIIKQIY